MASNFSRRYQFLIKLASLRFTVAEARLKVARNPSLLVFKRVYTGPFHDSMKLKFPSKRAKSCSYLNQ